MTKHDIVYILKNDYDSREIVYSIRSVCENFPYRKIWFYGGMPADITADRLVCMQQKGRNKWEKVRDTLRAICENDEITPDFWLFNDDFFIMQKVEELEPMIAGTLWERVQRIVSKRDGQESRYSLQLKECAKLLQSCGYGQLDYALHVPMLINRKKALQTIASFPGSPMFRSLYGNHHNIGGTRIKDPKIQDAMKEPTGKELFLSTNDNSFKDGAAGRYIRAAFPNKCKYEI